MHEQAEDRLRAGLAEGREDAFAALYDQFARPLHRVAWSLIGSRQDAEDVVQEVFLGLFRSRETIGKVENFRAYLFLCCGTRQHVWLRGQRRLSCRPVIRRLAI